MKRQREAEQLPEIIHINGVLHTLYTTPLLPLFRKLGQSWNFDQRTPRCQRGYIGRWEIRNDTLWLIDFYAWRDGQRTRLSDLFDGEDEVAADWFSGILVVEPASSEIPDGATPKMRKLFVEEGRVIWI